MTDVKELVETLREHATDWNGEQMPDNEPAKGDPTAGTLRKAADALEALSRDNTVSTADRAREQKAVAWRWTDTAGYNADYRYSSVDPREDEDEVRMQGAEGVMSCDPLYLHPTTAPDEGGNQ